MAELYGELSITLCREGYALVLSTCFPNPNTMDDSRFKDVVKDPKFRRIPRDLKKVKVDKRFQSMFNDKKFQLKYTVDRRGRPISLTQSENYRNFYELSSSGEGSSDEEEDKSGDEGGKSGDEEEKASSEERGLEEESKPEKEDVQDEKEETSAEAGPVSTKPKLPENVSLKLKNMSVDYARGVGTLFSDEESSSDESSSDESDSEKIEHAWGELDRDAERTEEATKRFAVCHMDWDRISATDLMVLFHSFLPVGGVIESVTIYPSEFGLQRMKEEDVQGPTELVTGVDDTKDDRPLDDEESEREKYHMEKLREYQLKRLKYFYAVVVCDTPETANKIYSDCDGMEYESSATKLDLRFIPDDMVFDQEPKEVCSCLPDVSKYQPRLFANTALQQGKVDLTWDETNPDRVEFNKKVLSGTGLDDDDLRAYIASSTSEEDSGDESAEDDATVEDSNPSENHKQTETDRINKYKALLASIQEKEDKKKKNDVEMEISWDVGLEDKTKSVIEEKKKKNQTPFEQMVEKKKERHKSKKKEESDNLYSDDELPSDVDLEDDYFKEELGKGKKSRKGKHNSSDEEDSQDEDSSNRKAELELLLADVDDSEAGKNHFSLKKIQDQENMKNNKKSKKWKKKKGDISQVEDSFKVDLNDDRFSALYTSHHFNIDQADPHFRKTEGMEKFIYEKQKRRHNDNPTEIDNLNPKKSKLGPDINALVASVKNKTSKNSSKLKWS